MNLEPRSLNIKADKSAVEVNTEAIKANTDNIAELDKSKANAADFSNVGNYKAVSDRNGGCRVCAA